MKKSDLVNAFHKRNVRDYTYAIMFFAVSTFFAFFVIRPVLSIAIAIQRQAQDLKEINVLYEKNITKALELQYQLEELRPRRHLIDTALPEQPHVDAVITDIRNAAIESNVAISSVSIDPINLKADPSQKEPVSNRNAEPLPAGTKRIDAKVTVNAPYTDIDRFLRALVNQRRIKALNEMNMTIGRSSSSSVQLSLTLELDAYYVVE